jgi:hypothetical protein
MNIEVAARRQGKREFDALTCSTVEIPVVSMIRPTRASRCRASLIGPVASAGRFLAEDYRQVASTM